MPEIITATIYGRTYQLTADALDLMMCRHLPASAAVLRARIAKAGGPGDRFETATECLMILAALDGCAITVEASMEDELRTSDVQRQNEARTAAEDEYDEPACEGHGGEDDDLMRGVGIGETTYCDGTCRH